MSVRPLGPAHGLEKKDGCGSVAIDQAECRAGQDCRRQRVCTHGVSLDGKDRGTVRKDRELVVVRLLAEDLPARQRRDASLDARLLEELSRLERDRNLGTGRDEGDGSVLGLADDVATLRGLLDRRVLELVQVLAGEAAGRARSFPPGQDGWYRRVRCENAGQTHQRMDGVRVEVKAM